MIRFIASGFWSGYLPFMPGTWGSIVGVFIVWLIIRFEFAISFGWLTLGTFLIGWICSTLLVKEAPEDLDPSYIVIDEIAGIFLVFALLQYYGMSIQPLMLLSGFLLFRLFDIVKPFPIGWVDNKLAQSIHTAGLGIMVDDLIAAIPTGIIIILIKSLRFF